MISSTSAAQSSMPLPGCVSRASVTAFEYTIAMTSTAPNPPTSCAIQYGTTSRLGNFPAIASPALTAGLKWPPEMCPKAVIASASPKPNPAAMPSGVIASSPMSTDNGDPAEAEEEEEKRSERLGCEARAEWLIHRRPSRSSLWRRVRRGSGRFLRGPRVVKRATGLEPATSSLEGWRSTN